MKSFISALGLLTAFPVPSKWTSHLTTCSAYFPAVGFVLGCMYYGIAIGLDIIQVSGEWTSIVILLGMIFFTRALHMDGLADMADGFGGGKNKDQILSIMKDSASGVFGVISLAMLLLVKWMALTGIVKSENHLSGVLAGMISVVVVSRLSMTVLAGLFSYARESGTGHIIINHTSRKDVAIAVLLTMVLLVLFTGPASLILMIVGCCISILPGLYSQFKINGITGDILGAACEISEAALLVFLPFIQLNFYPDDWTGIIFLL